jgi:hypothetical protein
MAKRWFKCSSHRSYALRRYLEKKNAAVIDAYRVPTLDFVSGEDALRRYTRAKVVDMAIFIEGGGEP